MESFWNEIRRAPEFVNRAAAVVLNSYFPGVLHVEIAEAVDIAVRPEWIWPLALPAELVTPDLAVSVCTPSSMTSREKG